MPDISKANPTIQRGLFGEDQPAKQKRDPRLTHWAVFDLRPKSRAVWGTGNSRDGALLDAVRWFQDYGGDGPGVDINDAEDLRVAIAAGEYVVTRCSRKLFKEVETYGGEIEFVMIPGAGIFLPTEPQGGKNGMSKMSR